MALTDFRQEFVKSFKSTLFAFSFGLGGLIAGLIVAAQIGVFRSTPWALALYPAILSAKGVIGGLLSGRLGTALHLGIIHPRFSNNTRSFRMLFEALVFITLATSVTMSLISVFFGTFFWGIGIADFPAIFSIIVATMGLGLSLTLITTEVAFVSFKKGLDPDIVVYPIMSTVADVLVTMLYVLILNVFFFFSFGRWIVAFVAIGVFLLAMLLLSRNLREPEFLRTVKESLVTMVFVAFIVNVTGTILRGISEVVESRGEIYAVYPALISMVGSVGSVVGSTATTKLALGLLKPSLTSIRSHASNILSAWSASILLFCVLAVSSLILTGNFVMPALLNLLIVLIGANMIACASIILISYGISILTFTKGLDPDNFVVPIESSLADSLTSVALLSVLVVTR